MQLSQLQRGVTLKCVALSHQHFSQIFSWLQSETIQTADLHVWEPWKSWSCFIFNYKEKIHSQILKWSNGLISVHQTVARVGCAEQSLKTALLQQPSLRWTNCSLFTLWVTECSKWFSSFFNLFVLCLCCLLCVETVHVRIDDSGLQNKSTYGYK